MDNLIQSTPAPPTMSTTNSAEASNEPIISPPPPLHLRIFYFLSIWSFKSIITSALFLLRLFTPQLHPLIKTYPIRPTLKNRIFLPLPSTSPTTSPNQDAKYPIYFSIHGGGWAIADPAVDDKFCSSFSKKNNIIVVSLDYRKSPTSKFPFAVTDIVSVILAILDDDELPIDKERVAIGGFSAGGNLAFAACQDEGLRGMIKGVVGLYPVLDMSESREVKESRRPKGKDVPSDGIGWSADFLDWGYVPLGQDRRDPLLSPRFARPEMMPESEFLVGAEWDMLCGEAEATAENLVVKGVERRKMEGEGWDGWVQGGVRWECFRRRSHAFVEVKEWGRKKEEERVRVVEELFDRMGEWLRDVWAESRGP